MGLISHSDVEARLGRRLTDEEINAFAIINTANQAYVERLIGSSVEQVEASTRVYDGGVQHMSIDPVTDVSVVATVDDDGVVQETLDTSDYQIEPVNGTLKYMVRFRSSHTSRGINNYRVTGKFSIYADQKIRDIVKNALIESFIGELNNNEDIVKESIEGYSVEYAKSTSRNYLDKITYLFPQVV